MIFKLTRVRVVDGDSIEATIHQGLKTARICSGIRLKGIDTPETRTKDKLQKKAGKLVTKWLKAKKKKSVDFRLETGRTEFDKFGRVLGIFYIDEENICLELLKKRFARDYQGEKKPPWKVEQLEYIINQLTKEKEK